MVLKTAKFLKDCGFEISFKATLSFDMLDHLPDIWRSYLNLRESLGSFVQYSPTLDMTTSDPDVLGKWRANLMKLAKLEYKLWKDTGNTSPLLAPFELGTKKRVCDMRNTVMMHDDGNFYICHGCAYLPDEKRKMLVIGNTKTTSIEQALQEAHKIDFSKRNHDCMKCPATWCTTCHSMHVDPSNYRDDWLRCLSSNKTRCEFFKVFSTIARALHAAKIFKT